MLKSALLPIATLAAAAALTTAAAAQPVGGVVVRGTPPAGVEVKRRPVSFGDIDANSPDGARILFHRIRAAAQEVCSPQPDGIRNLLEYTDYQDFARCELDGITLAVADVNSPALNRYVDGLRYQ
jgi:UrcA family protein